MDDDQMKKPSKTEVDWISSSQMDEFEDCPRRWWFHKVQKLRDLPKDYFTFGTVLHGVCERWLAGDDQGRVPAGEQWDYEPEEGEIYCLDGPLAKQKVGDPINLFPDGWDTSTERDGSVSKVSAPEAALIRMLVEQAVERGILQRYPGKQIEREVNIEVIDGVWLSGYIDFAWDGVDGIPEIHDHKTFGQSSTRYLKQPGPKDDAGVLIPIVAPYKKGDGTSPNSIGHNPQLLTYAAVMSQLDEYTGPMVLQHNQFPKFKDPKGVRHVRALVGEEVIAERWLKIQTLAAEMQKVRKIKKWEDTPPPESTDACGRYGGCAFINICGRRERPADYSKRVERTIANKSAKRPTNLEPRKKRTKASESTMGIFDTMKKNQGNKAAASAPVSNPINGGKPEVVAPAPVVVEGDAAPWANPACRSKGCTSGVSSKNQRCPICDSTAAKRGVPSSTMYELSNGEDGLLVAVAQEEHIEALEAMGAPLEWVQGAASEIADTPAPKPQAATQPAAKPAKAKPVTDAKPAKVEAPVAEPTTSNEPETQVDAVVVAEAPVDEPVADAKPATRGRKKLGLTIFIGASQVKGPRRDVVVAQQLMHELGMELAESMGADTYHELDCWKRRDRIRERIESVANDLARKVLVVPAVTDPDTDNLVSALIPFAEVVIEGTR